MAERDAGWPGWTVLHGGALGDLVLTIQLALRLPGADAGLHLLSRVNPGDLSRCSPRMLPRILRTSTETLGLHWLFGDAEPEQAPSALSAAIAGRRVLNALGGLESSVARRLALLRPEALYSVDVAPRAGDGRHITVQWQAQLERQGLAAGESVAALRDDGGAASKDADGGCGPPIDTVLIHPGSGGRAKCWPLERFVEVARRLRDDRRVNPLFVLGPAELERWDANEIAQVAAEFPLVRGPAPDELLGLIARAAAYLGNDAGPTHLAALLGVPTVALFGPTDPAVWGPLGPRVRVLARRAAEAGWGIGVQKVVRGVASSE